MKEKKKWHVYAEVGGSKFLGTYEAYTALEAEKFALDDNKSISLCAYCSGGCEEAEIREVIVKESE